MPDQTAKLKQALEELVEYMEEQDPHPTSDEHPLYFAREVLKEMEEDKNQTGEQDVFCPHCKELSNGMVIYANRFHEHACINGHVWRIY